MKKRYMVISINYTTKRVVLVEVIRTKTKEKGEDVEFTGKNVKYAELKDTDAIGKIYTYTESFN